MSPFLRTHTNVGTTKEVNEDNSLMLIEHERAGVHLSRHW